MKMDRNISPDGFGKYAVVNLRKAKGLPPTLTEEMAMCLAKLEALGVLEWGNVATEDEFFLIKLKDRHSAAALHAYAASVYDHDREFAAEVSELAKRAGEKSPFCKEPD